MPSMTIAIESIPIAKAREYLEQRTAAEVIAFVEPLLDELEKRDGDARIDVVDGDIVTDTLVREWGSPLLVFGSVRSAGLVGADEGSPLLVMGDLAAHDVYAASALYVRGNLAVQGLLYLNSLNDYSAFIEGNASARLLVEEGTHTTICGLFEGTVASTMNSVHIGPSREIAPHVDDDVLRSHLLLEAFETDQSGNGGLADNLLRMLREGLPVLVSE